MDRSRLDIAKTGESLAVAHLKARGYEILAQGITEPSAVKLILSHKMAIVSFLWKLKRDAASNSGSPQAAVTAAETATDFQSRFGISTRRMTSLTHLAVLMLSQFTYLRSLSC